MSSLEDSAVDAARAGDGQAFRQVYECLAPAVVGYLRSQGSRDPEGLTSEVFITLFRTLPHLTGGAAGLRSFVFSVAHARLVDERRATQRRPGEWTYDPETDPRWAESAETSAVRRISTAQALRMLDELGATQRDVISLRVVAGLSLEETALVLGRSVGAVKQLQRRGLLVLKSIAQRQGVTR